MAARCGLRGPGAVYTLDELGESFVQRRAIRWRLDASPNATICRTCLHNSNKADARWCSRHNDPDAGTAACERCERCGSSYGTAHTLDKTLTDSYTLSMNLANTLQTQGESLA